MPPWTAADIPDQSGRTFVVTGANSGLGAVIASQLARAGGHVVVACRDIGKGEEAADAMPGDREVRHLDLADLGSIRAFADGVGQIDVLINNAGVMATPLARTTDGFELQIGTNHLGHFALTGLLIGRVSDRVVTMSSGAHRMGRIDFDDLNWERRRYQRWAAYGQSKLANLLFTYELQRRWAASGSSGAALAAHPGYAATNLQSHTDSFQDRVMEVTNRVFAQSADMGALPRPVRGDPAGSGRRLLCRTRRSARTTGTPDHRQVIPALLRPGHRPVAVDPVGNPDRRHFRLRLSRPPLDPGSVAHRPGGGGARSGQGAVTALEAGDGLPTAMAFLAATVNVYDFPLVNPVMVWETAVELKTIGVWVTPAMEGVTT